MKTAFFETQKIEAHLPRAILVGVDFPYAHGTPPGDSLDELTGLARTAHYDPVATLTQRLTTINPKTYLGSGKVEELLQAVKHHDAEIVIFDENLSPAQTRNLENLLKVNVVDRSWIILEIFGDHARTREAKTQVELARLKYTLPRLTRMWGHLSRQRGGIGLRDVGEKQIQLDRRMIRDQISKLTEKLKRIHREKQTQRKSRMQAYQVALVGYTNVGKSTLMNCLTGAGTRVEDKLFATLDATVRKVKKNFPYPILLADTVGLIDKLPHDLVASFNSTLDEVRNADLLLHVVDISHPHYRRQMATAEAVLNELGVHSTPAVMVFNKIDRLDSRRDVEEMRNLHPNAVFVSCREETGMKDLRKAIVQHYEAGLVPYQVKLEYTKSDLIPEIRKHALVVDEHYHDDAVTLDLRIWPTHKSRLMELLNGRLR